MKKALLVVAGLIFSVSNGQPKAHAWEYGYEQICFFNGSPRRCAVNHGYRIPLAKGSNVDIHWEDGQITTIRYASNNGPLSRGDKVIINGKINGIVADIFNNTRGGREIDNYAKIKSDSGNTFAYQYIMD